MIGMDLPARASDPFSCLLSVVRGNPDVETVGGSTPDNNLIVMHILEAARISAERGETVLWEAVK